MVTLVPVMVTTAMTTDHHHPCDSYKRYDSTNKPSNDDHHDGHNGVAVGVVTVLMLTGMIVRTETTIWRRAQADQARLYKGRSVDHPTTTNIDGGSGGGSGDGGVDDHDADEINA